MPQTNILVNGSFAGGSSGWTGTDLETTYSESAYLGNGSSNKVAELDGHTGQTTVMEQTFTVVAPIQTELTLDTALRTASLPDAGSEGFTVEIVDSSGTVIASQTVIPTSSSYTTVVVPVSFDAAGTYTLRLTELGPDNSLGAIVDNVSILTCFVGGTLVDTPRGPRTVESLGSGDLVTTPDGPLPVLWAGQTRIGRATLQADPRTWPIRIAAGALGPGLPCRDLFVSRQHRMLVSNRVAERITGSPQAFAKALSLCGLAGCGPWMPDTDISYHHLLLERHAVIFAEAAPTESLLLGPQSLVALNALQLADIERVRPGAAQPGAPTTLAAWPTMSRRQVRTMLGRLARNGRALVASAPAPAALARVS